jgi:hypothetical protein
MNRFPKNDFINEHECNFRHEKCLAKQPVETAIHFFLIYRIIISLYYLPWVHIYVDYCNYLITFLGSDQARPVRPLMSTAVSIRGFYRSVA